jgi:hypothetical protein
MSVSLTQTSQSFSTGGGVTTFSITAFTFLDADELLVVRNTAGVPTTLVKDTDYTVSGGNNSTGSITTPSAIAAGSTLLVTRVTKKTQLTSYTTGDRFPATTHERALDKLTMLVQEATASSLPPTATASGSAPYVLQAASTSATPAWVPQSAGGIAAGAITNTMLAGSITADKLSTGAPTWNAGGTLTAISFNGPVTGAVTGNASTSTRLATSRTIGLSGDVTGTASFDGSANATIASTIANLPNGIVTASKLGTNEQRQIAKAWVNFDGSSTSAWAGGTSTVSRTAGSTTATITTTTAHGLVAGSTVYASSGVAAGAYTVLASPAPTTTTFSITTIATTALNANTITFWASPIRGSHNVSSVAKLAAGAYRINFSTPITLGYAVSGLASNDAANACWLEINEIPAQGGSPTTTSLGIRAIAWGSSTIVAQDSGQIGVQIFGN